MAKNSFLYHKELFADFILELEFQISGVPSANSGIQFRSRKQADGYAAGYQADMDQGAEWLGRINEEHGRKLISERGVRTVISLDGRRWTEPFPAAGNYQSLPLSGAGSGLPWNPRNPAHSSSK